MTDAAHKIEKWRENSIKILLAEILGDIPMNFVFHTMYKDLKLEVNQGDRMVTINLSEILTADELYDITPEDFSEFKLWEWQG